jgi:hypothetical protein
VGHHGCRGTTTAAMVHRVLSIDVCVVHGNIHLPATIRLYCSREQFIPPLARVTFSELIDVHADGGQLGTERPLGEKLMCAPPRNRSNTDCFLMDHSLASHHEAPKIRSVFTGVWGYTVHACVDATIKSHHAVFFLR